MVPSKVGRFGFGYLIKTIALSSFSCRCGYCTLVSKYDLQISVRTTRIADIPTVWFVSLLSFATEAHPTSQSAQRQPISRHHLSSEGPGRCGKDASDSIVMRHHSLLLVTGFRLEYPDLRALACFFFCFLISCKVDMASSRFCKTSTDIFVGQLIGYTLGTA